VTRKHSTVPGRHRLRQRDGRSAVGTGHVLDLTFENSHLVPQHHDLDVLVRLGPTDEWNDTDLAHLDVLTV